jgi:hypothetical protein
MRNRDTLDAELAKLATARQVDRSMRLSHRREPVDLYAPSGRRHSVLAISSAPPTIRC